MDPRRVVRAVDKEVVDWVRMRVALVRMKIRQQICVEEALAEAERVRWTRRVRVRVRGEVRRARRSVLPNRASLARPNNHKWQQQQPPRHGSNNNNKLQRQRWPHSNSSNSNRLPQQQRR